MIVGVVHSVMMYDGQILYFGKHTARAVRNTLILDKIRHYIIICTLVYGSNRKLV